jgi:cytochrome subunit of sulfide dehydrogenase
MEYMSAQTKLFVSGKRRFPFMMDEAYAGLNAEQLEAVAQFFAAQEQLKPRK